MAYEFRFPDVGEGIAEGEILGWKVREGDTVAQDQTLVEVETDKAVVELPAPKAGKILSLHGAEGDIINVGAVLVTIEEAGATGGARSGEGTPESEAAPPSEAAPAAASGEAETQEVPYTGSVVGKLEEAPEEEPPSAGPAAPSAAASPTAPSVEILALPSVRALAKELGVDLSTIRGTGTGGRILKQDVEDVAQAVAYGVPPAATGGAAPAGAGVPAAPESEAPVHGGTLDQDGFGPVERVPFRGVRRTMAKRMAESAAKQATVTTTDVADVTVIRRIREKEKEIAAERGVHLTYLAFAIKACTASLRRFPRLNAVLEESGDEYVLKRYYNIGIAVDTKNGLVVPNIKDADNKSIFQIAAEIIDLAKKAEDRSLDLADLHGGTFTITNYGAIGGIYATPIANYPEVAILGMGRISEVPLMHDGQIAARLTLPLALTFDHRLIDGAEAARFLNTVVGYLQDPDLLLLEGA
jgi:pyruvate dehydrogenase E2 component (dihydrolipoamide acetyltransferase)